MTSPRQRRSLMSLPSAFQPTLWSTMFSCPSIRAPVEVSRGNPGKAIEMLQAATPFEFGWPARVMPSYVRGQAYLHLRQGKEAAEQFQNILSHRGVCGTLVACSLAHLQIGASPRALRRQRRRPHRLPGFLRAVERCRPGCPHPERSQSRVRQAAAVAQKNHVGTAAPGCPAERSSAVLFLGEVAKNKRLSSCARPDSRGRLSPRGWWLAAAK